MNTIACYAAALAVAAASPLDMVENGRLTDVACWTFMILVVVAVTHLFHIDHTIRTGRRAPDSIPRFMQDPDLVEQYYR